jgi:hypothetical protein
MRSSKRAGLRAFLWNNGLSLAALGLFLLSLVGQWITGHAAQVDAAREHGTVPPSLVQYLGTGEFIETVFENWESEFLQMGIFVVLTKYLRQKGSSESKKVNDDQEDRRDDDRAPQDACAPWPVRRGGFLLWLYERSLSTALFLLFAISFALHATGGAARYNADQALHDGPRMTAPRYVATAQFWFESFQNWQSEFLSIGVLILLSVVLRERGSSQSKAVAAPHGETGQ